MVMSRECTTIESSLPVEALELFKAAKTFDQLEELARRVKSGRGSPTMQDISEMLAEWYVAKEKCPEAAATRSDLVAGASTLESQFAIAFSSYTKNSNGSKQHAQRFKTIAERLSLRWRLGTSTRAHG